MRSLRNRGFGKRGLLISVFLWAAGAVSLFAHGDLHEQIEAVSVRIRAKPGDAALYFKRAELHRLHQEFLTAEADYRKAEQLDPALIDIHLGCAKLLVTTGKLNDARNEVDRFLFSSPNHLDALLTRARLEMKRERPLVAAEDYARVVDLAATKPEPEYYIEHARALAAAGPRYVSDAVMVLDKGTAKLGELPTLITLAIELELSRKNFEAALGRLEKLTSRSRRKESLLARRGDILEQADRFQEAQAEYAAALREIENLPTQIRMRKATVELESRLRTKIAGLSDR